LEAAAVVVVVMVSTKVFALGARRRLYENDCNSSYNAKISFPNSPLKEEKYGNLA
jgi:hypothetical protein